MVDVTTWISRLMLDNIGEGTFVSPTINFKFLTWPKAAFEHQFNAVDAGGVGELSEAFNNLLFVPFFGYVVNSEISTHSRISADSLLFPDKGTIFFTSLWRFIPPNILRFVEYLPARQVRRFRQFLSVSKQAARDVIKKRATSLTCDDENKDILSILGGVDYPFCTHFTWFLPYLQYDRTPPLTRKGDSMRTNYFLKWRTLNFYLLYLISNKC